MDAALLGTLQSVVRAAEDKKGHEIRILDLRPVTSFTDFFLIVTGANSPQIQAIADEIGRQLVDLGEHPVSVEGYQSAEWILLDYSNFIVHVFSEKARTYYDLERLWRHAKHLDLGLIEATVA